jgi:hypothetical protein
MTLLKCLLEKYLEWSLQKKADKMFLKAQQGE